MESAAVNSAATRNGGVPMSQTTSFSSSPHASRKEWGVLSEQSIRNEELERSKLGDERSIYELKHGRETVDVDFSAITIDGAFDNDLSQQRLHAVVKQREELQQMEIELRAQFIARSEIANMQNNYEAQIQEYATAGVKLQEQLDEKEQKIHELERRIEEKERELHSIRLDYEAAWAKEDLIREQNKELHSYRRERDNSEAERLQHIKQIHDLQEHIEEKKRQFMELEEQQRIAQETILFKDEQIREAQSWMTRAQEMDALQSTTNHALQAELRERTEQCNQLWLGCQGQFAEMERLHSYIQQLQLELADTKEKNGVHSDGSNTNSKDVSQVENDNSSHLEVNGKNSPIAGSDIPQNGNTENVQANSSGVNSLTQTDQVHGVAFAPPSLLGMTTYLPSGQMAAFHPFLMHQQGVPHPSHVTQSHFHSIPPMSSIQHWSNPQVLLDAQQANTDEQHHPNQTEQNMSRTDSHYDYDASVHGQVSHMNRFDSNLNVASHADSILPSPNEIVQVHDMIAKDHDDTQAQPQNLQEISSHFDDALRLDSLKHTNETEDKKVNTVTEEGYTNKNSVAEHSIFSADPSLSETVAAQTVIFGEITAVAAFSVGSADSLISTGQKSNVVENSVDNFLLDERALLACIARTIGSRGRIKISSTLPNRLGKMLAPLHWHDYKKKYGKLDDFVAGHPDLFLVEGDYIQLREGAQQIIAASAAVAKVAAVAAAEPSPFSSSFAVTPMAQPHRLRKVPSLGSSSVNSDKSSVSELAVSRPPSETTNHHSQISAVQNRSMNVEILSKGKDHVVQNGYEVRRQQNRSIGAAGPGMKRL